jgi:hypothetical protein
LPKLWQFSAIPERKPTMNDELVECVQNHGDNERLPTTFAYFLFVSAAIPWTAAVFSLKSDGSSNHCQKCQQVARASEFQKGEHSDKEQQSKD